MLDVSTYGADVGDEPDSTWQLGLRKEGEKTSAPTFVSAVLPLKVRPNLSLRSAKRA